MALSWETRGEEGECNTGFLESRESGGVELAFMSTPEQNILSLR